MDRRRFVAGVGAALPWIAGCTRLESGTDDRGPQYTLEAYPIGDDGIRVTFAARAGELSDEALNAFLAALDGRSRTYGHAVISDGRLVEYGGRFYRVTVEETGQKTRKRPILRAEVVDREAAKRKAVDWSAYSGDDSAAVRHVASRAEGRSAETPKRANRSDGKDGTDGREGAQRDFYVLRHRDPETSRLLPEPEHEYVEYGDSVVRLAVERRRLAETEYTYVTTKVADSTTAFREFVRERVVDVWLDGSALSARQRTIFERAGAGEYAESGDLSAAYRGLLERIFGRERPTETTGERIGYDGRLYRVLVHVAGS